MPGGRSENSARAQGVRPSTPLTADRIVATAMRLIDDGGPDAFSMRNVAKALDVYPTAIYHHVGDRRQLLALVGASWLHGVIPPARPDAPFTWIREMGHAYRDAAHRHPNIARLIASELVTDASSFALAEIVVFHLVAAGVPATELVHMYNVMTAAVVGFVDLEFARMPTVSDAFRETVQRDVRGLDPAEHPTLSRHLDQFANRAFSLRWSSGDEAPMDDSFEFLLDVLVDAVRSRARAVKRRR